MKIISIISYILAAIFILFGVLFLWASFGEQFNSGWFVTGLITAGIGFGLLIAGYFIGRRSIARETATETVTLKIDLPGNVNLDSLKCRSCGGVLTSENVKLVAGAPVVTCPYCGTTYQITEEPKW